MSIYFDAVKEDARKTLLKKSKFIQALLCNLEVSLCCHSNVFDFIKKKRTITTLWSPNNCESLIETAAFSIIPPPNFHLHLPNFQSPLQIFTHPSLIFTHPSLIFNHPSLIFTHPFVPKFPITPPPNPTKRLDRTAHWQHTITITQIKIPIRTTPTKWLGHPAHGLWWTSQRREHN